MADESEEFEFRLRAEQEAQQISKPDVQPKVDLLEKKTREAVQAQNPITRGIENVGEVGIQASSGAYHTIKGGLTGLADLASGQGGIKAQRDIEAEEAKIYKPQTREGQIASKVAGYIPEKISQGAKYVAEKARSGSQALGASPEVSGAIGAGVETLGQVAGPSALAQGGRGVLSRSREVGFPKGEAPPLPEAPRTRSAEMVSLARSKGYVLKPSEAGGKLGTTAEGVSGSPRLSNEASLKNQKVTNDLNNQDIGLKPGERATESNLSKAEEPHHAVYEEMKGLGTVATDETYKKSVNSVGRTPGESFKKADRLNPEISKLRRAYRETSFDSADAIQHIRQLRADARKNLKLEDPKANALGSAQLQIAKAIEDQMERHATSVGKPDLVTRFRYARQQLAKIETTRDVLRGEDVSAQGLARLKNRGVPLSGHQLDIANIAEEFKEVTRDAHDVRNKVPVTVYEGGAGAVGAALTAAHNPAIGLPIMAGMVARPITRKALLSDWYQKKLGKGPEHTVAELE